jgi:hypothetical protein
MSDFRNANDPLWRDTGYGSGARSYGSVEAWIAGALFLAVGAVFLTVVLVLALGARNQPNQTASNDTTPPAVTRLAPLSTSVPHPTNQALPGLVPPPAAQGINISQ